MCSLLKNTEPFPPVATVNDGGNERTRSSSSSGFKMTLCVSFFYNVRIIVQLRILFFIKETEEDRRFIILRIEIHFSYLFC